MLEREQSIINITQTIYWRKNGGSEERGLDRGEKGGEQIISHVLELWAGISDKLV